MQNDNWRRRVAIVTGGSSGIGRATAFALAELGVSVHCLDRQEPQGDQSEWDRLGLTFTACDIRREPALRDAIEAVATGQGRIDILVNNAGIAMVKPVTEVTEADWDACLDVNLKAMFFGCRYVIPYMQRQGGGSIVNVASNAGLLPRAHDPVYSISKMAAVGLTRSLALCHSVDLIRVNAVCPGPVGDTGMMNADLDEAADRAALARSIISASPLARALDRMITPREVADSIVYLCSDAAQMITGTMIAIDGGKSLGVPPAIPS